MKCRIEYFFMLLSIGLTVSTLYLSHVIRKPNAPVRNGLEHARTEKHILNDMAEPEPSKTEIRVSPPNVSKRLFVLTTGERTFSKPNGFDIQKVFGAQQAGVVAQTYDEGYGPKAWPLGARRVAEGHVTVWKRIAAECPDWCFVSEDDAIWPDLPVPDMPPDGIVSYFSESVCTAATRPYSDDYRQVVKSVVRGRCMPYGAVAYALSGSFAKTLLNALPMDKPVDHFLWEQAVKHHMGFVARYFWVKHARGKSLRESVVTSHDDSEYIMYKDVDQIGFDIGGAPIVSAREFCSKRRDCMAYNHMGWAKSSLNHVQSVRGVQLYVKRKHALSSFRAGVAEKQPPVHTNCDFEMNEPVDVVYTWVNWTAPAYVAQMRKHGILYGEHKESHMNYEKTSDDSSYEELRYSMSSLLKHGGNIGKIYVVINPIHGPPAWLDTSHPNVEIVHHSKILPNVPTNNAWAIATAIHRIPGLSKWFLALNDDVILNKNLEINSRLIQCPRSELQYSHCPTLRNTCLMRALEKHFEARVQKVFDYRKKSTTSYRPDVVLWLEHHNWMVANGHATYEPDSNWFGLVNTNAWRKDSNWVNRRWGQVLKKAERSMWINFQGQGISWEYPENEAIRRQYHSWIAVRGYDKHFDAMRKKKEKREPRIAVVIPTYNRVGYVRLCANALSKTIDHKDVYVFDDHSDQFSIDDLKSWFETTNVRQNEKRLKPDKQARAIVEWFIETDYDWLVTLDSDLIVRPDWFAKFEHHLKKTQGIVSLYHSGNRNHPTGKCTDGLCEMKTLGNAGVAWSKSLAKRMLSAMKNRDGFDWGWTNWLQKQGIPQYAFEDSLVLHVGMHGTWGADSKREKSKGFDMSTLSKDIRLRAGKFLNGMRPKANDIVPHTIMPPAKNNNNVAIVRSGRNELGTSEFILYLPQNAEQPKQRTIAKFKNILVADPTIDVIGGLMLAENRLENPCFDIEICHWSILYHYEYTWSKGSFMKCDTTSPIFLARKKWFKDIDFSQGVLTALDFFMKAKKKNAKIVTDVSETMPKTPALQSGQYSSFVRKYGVDQIRNRYTRETIDLCKGCDARIMRDILGKSWNHYGITMPNFAYKAYVVGFQKAIGFLNKMKVPYRLYGGSHLGLLKLGRLLPWDAGDIDINVDVSKIGCKVWLKRLKQWAGENEFIHPHAHAPAGASCGNYGVYAMPKGSDVRDPFSIGLLSFMGQLNSKKVGETAIIQAHGVDAHVSLDIWGAIKHKYDAEALSHKKHQRYGNSLTACNHAWEHNCVRDTVGTHVDTCIEYTQFYNI